jgi:excisionase family DNA binding protein
MTEEDTLMTSSEVCEYLRISKKTLTSWICSKDKDKLPIPLYKVGGSYRFKKKDVDSLIIKVN